MHLPTYFDDFLTEIRMTPCQRTEAKNGHQRLRTRLTTDEDVKDCIISTFIQGSYRRATAIRPKGDKRSDVDVIVVTNLDAGTNTPAEVLRRFQRVLEKYYPGKCVMQGRSIGIELSGVDLDVVITSAPSEAAKEALRSDVVTGDLFLDEALDWDEGKLFKTSETGAKWKSEPLKIPDRETKEWQRTDPLSQIAVAVEKNRACSGHFVNTVKALKWWRGAQELPKYPKGYPFERLITECCPEAIESVAEGITRTMEAFVSRYDLDVATGCVPKLADYGVPEHDVMKRVEFADFEKLFDAVKEAAPQARAALDEQGRTESACMWRDLLGEKFPKPPGGCEKNDSGNGSAAAGAGFVAPRRSSDPGPKRFA